ncbi:MAG: choice-of-anchor V domain-containing protein, partial [Candidatus Thermoplasmatota archaeon]|nr:choice-of-anchor V domain-containing protein [Candidatus Thermoplasmatota archaeon]
MSQRRVIVAVTVVALLLFVPAIRGYEGGVYNHAYGCNCHSQTGSTAASVGISGLPSSYDAGDLYQLTVSVSGGVPGSSGGFSLEVNKGTLSTGVGLMLVNVNNQGNSATHSITGSSYRSWSFDWTAPNLGAGLV